MAITVDGTNGITFPNASVQSSAPDVTVFTYDYIKLTFDSEDISTLYNSYNGSQVTSYLEDDTTYVSVIESQKFF